MLLWKGDSNGRCIVRVNVTLLQVVSDRTSPCKLLRNNLVPPKVSFLRGKFGRRKSSLQSTSRRGFLVG